MYFSKSKRSKSTISILKLPGTAINHYAQFVFKKLLQNILMLKYSLHNISWFTPVCPRPRKNFFWDILFCPNGSKKNFGPNGWKAAELLDRLFTTEWQSHRVTPLPLPIRVGEIFLCQFSINSPTRFARRGIIFFLKEY